MKKLIPNPDLTAEVWVPEDGIDHRTAASLELAFQALLNRIDALAGILPALRPWGNDPGTYVQSGYITERTITRSDTHVWIKFTAGDKLRRWNLITMQRTSLVDPGISSWIRYNPYTGTLFAHGDTTNNLYAVIRRSSDLGDTWATVLNDTTKQARYIGFSPTTVLVVGGNDIYISTNDGLTWTAYVGTANGNPLSANTINDIRWDGYQWWMISDGRVLTSPDGIVWVSQAGGWSAVSNFAGIVVHNGKVYLPTNPVYAWDITTSTWSALPVYGGYRIAMIGGRPMAVGTDSGLFVDLLTTRASFLGGGTFAGANAELIVYQQGFIY